MELNAIGHGKSDISGFLCELGKSIHFKALSNVDRGYLEIPFLIPPCEYANMPKCFSYRTKSMSSSYFYVASLYPAFF